MPATKTSQVNLSTLMDSDKVVAVTTLPIQFPHSTTYNVYFHMNELKSFRITNGVELMKAVIETILWKQNYHVQRLNYEVQDTRRITFHW